MNSLSPDFLLLIFNQFPFQHQLSHLRIVCKQWKTILEQFNFVTQTSLKLFSSHDSVEQYCFDLMLATNRECESYFKLEPIESLNDDLTLSNTFCGNQLKLLIKLFPNVQQIIIYFPEDFQSEFAKAFANLNFLDQFRVLNSVSLFNYSFEDFRTIQISNSLIKKLEFFNCGDYSLDKKSKQFIEQIVPQLNHFSMLGNVEIPFNEHENVTIDKLKHLLERKPFLVNSLTSLNFTQVNGLKMFNFICQQFSSLQTLEIWFRDSILINKKTLQILSQLKHLTELKLRNVEIPFIKQKNMVKLENIKNLYLCFEEENEDPDEIDAKAFCTILSGMFPNVEQLVIKYDEIVEKKIEDNFDLKKYLTNLKMFKSYYKDEFKDWMGQYRRGQVSLKHESDNENESDEDSTDSSSDSSSHSVS